MNKLFYAMAVAMNGTAQHAWKVTRDYFDDGEDSSVGTMGPSEAPEPLCDELRSDNPGRPVWKWSVYDDDGEHLADGVLVTEFDTPEDDETGANGALMAPLSDFAEGNWGCTEIRWDGHPDWDCG